MSSVLGKRFSMLGMVVTAAMLAGCAMDQVPTSPLRTPGAAHRVLDPAPVVTNTNDAGPGSLRDAIENAAQGATVTFADAIAGQTITLTSGELLIGIVSLGGGNIDQRTITIVGPATKGITIDGNGTSRVFDIGFVPAKLTLVNATVTHGRAVGGNGGGILVQGSLDLRNSTMTENSATKVAGIESGLGGAIFIHSLSSAVTITNSTVTGNTAGSTGSAIAAFSASPLVLINSTISEDASNIATYVLLAHLTLTNSILTSSGSGLEGPLYCAPASTVVTSGMNIIGGSSTCLAAGPNVTIGSPNLGLLADNGGPTKTMAPIFPSAAIDGAPSCSVTEDQRHVARPLGGACDIGAVEFDRFITSTLKTDASVVVNPTTGVAVVTGMFTCSADGGAVTLKVSLHQPTKVGRVNTSVDATGTTSVVCHGTTPWSIALQPATGAFGVGMGTVDAQTINLQPGIRGSSTLGAPVKLFWGHK
jgi:hypothetical protein